MNTELCLQKVFAIPGCLSRAQMIKVVENFFHGLHTLCTSLIIRHLLSYNHRTIPCYRPPFPAVNSSYHKHLFNSLVSNQHGNSQLPACIEIKRLI